MKIKTNKIVTLEAKVGKYMHPDGGYRDDNYPRYSVVYAFKKDKKNNLYYQPITSLDSPNTSYDEWEMVDMMRLDDKYKMMVEEAIKQLK
jgi:hypothetical protein|tara:strand:- start:27 stop:296 length:270 start_codon:yes stop_codon:yes gene_type:complete